MKHSLLCLIYYGILQHVSAGFDQTYYWEKCKQQINQSSKTVFPFCVSKLIIR